MHAEGPLRNPFLVGSWRAFWLSLLYGYGSIESTESTAPPTIL
jgi:hypothetical protein